MAVAPERGARLAGALAAAGVVAALLSTSSADAGVSVADRVLTDEDLGTFGGITVDDVMAVEPNTAFAPLGFTEVEQQVAAASTMVINPLRYGYGTDLSSLPTIDPPGTMPIGLGSLQIRFDPEDFPSPFEDEHGYFVSQGDLAASGPTTVVWVDFEDGFDHNLGHTINEGALFDRQSHANFEDTRAEGDTWLMFDLFPTVTYDPLPFALTMFEFRPPQSFPPNSDLTGFAMRSGNSLIVGVDTAGLAANDPLDAILYGFHLHHSPDPFTRGVVTTFPPHSDRTSAPVVATNDPLTPGTYCCLLDPTDTTPATDGDATIEEDLGDEDATVQPADEAGEDPPDEVTATASEEPSDGGTAESDTFRTWVPVVLVVFVAMVLVGGLWIYRTRGRDRSLAGIGQPTPRDEPTPEDEVPTPEDELPTPEDEVPTPEDEVPTPEDEVPTPEDEVPTPEDEVPTPKDEIPTPEERDDGAPRGGAVPAGLIASMSCDWELHYWTGTRWEVLRPARSSAHKCCVYKVRVETKVTRHEQAAKFRQDDHPERLFIPDFDIVWRAMELDASASTQSGPAERLDWVQGLGDPIEQSDQTTDEAYWPTAQGEEPPEVAVHLAHDETTRIGITLDARCTDQEHTYRSAGDSTLTVSATHECTNEDPAVECLVELDALGRQWGEVWGALNWVVFDDQITDTDELELLMSARAQLDGEQRSEVPAEIPVHRSWQSHDHGVRNRPTYEGGDIDSGTDTRKSLNWTTWVRTEIELDAGQVVPMRVWPTTERVTAHIEQQMNHSIRVSGEMKMGGCVWTGCCTGNTGHVCHCDGAFELRVDSAISEIMVDGRTFRIARDPASADRDSPPSLAVSPTYQAWQLV